MPSEPTRPGPPGASIPIQGAANALKDLIDRHGVEETTRRLQAAVSQPQIIECGPATAECCCECIDGGPCEHVWDGRTMIDENTGSATCSRCGMAAIDHDLWVLP